MKYHAIRNGVIILLLLITMNTGCAGTSAQSRFFLLSSLDDRWSTDNNTANTNNDQSVKIGIGPLKLPEYLDRPQIVTRSTENELHLADYDRWAGSLKEDITRVLAENIGVLLGTDKVVIYPWRRNSLIDYQVELDVIRFDAVPGREAFLKARWAVFNKDGDKLLLTKTTNAQGKIKAPGFDGLVAAESALLEKLSHEIARGITGLQQTGSAGVEK